MQIEKYDLPNRRFTGDSANYAQSLSGAFSHNLQSGRCYPVADKSKETTQQVRDKPHLMCSRYATEQTSHRLNPTRFLSLRWKCH